MRYLSLLTILMLPFLSSCGCSNQNDKEISLTKEEALEFINDNYKENAITPIKAEALYDYADTSGDLIEEAKSDIMNFVDEDTDISKTKSDNPININTKKQQFVDQLITPPKEKGDEGEVYISMNATYFSYLNKSYTDITYTRIGKSLTIKNNASNFIKFIHTYNELGHETYFRKDVNYVPNGNDSLTYTIELSFTY